MNISILFFTWEDIDVVIVTVKSANHYIFSLHAARGALGRKWPNGRSIWILSRYRAVRSHEIASLHWVGAWCVNSVQAFASWSKYVFDLTTKTLQFCAENGWHSTFNCPPKDVRGKENPLRRILVLMRCVNQLENQLRLNAVKVSQQLKHRRTTWTKEVLLLP